jgi:hypothetical protein
MTQSYEWLDPERASSEVYAERVHSACICEWDRTEHYSPNVPDLPVMKLIARRKTCAIHGAKGEI